MTRRQEAAVDCALGVAIGLAISALLFFVVKL